MKANVYGEVKMNKKIEIVYAWLQCISCERSREPPYDMYLIHVELYNMMRKHNFCMVK